MTHDLRTTRDYEKAAAEVIVHLPKLIAEKFGISRSEARRLIGTEAVKLDGKPLLDLDLPARALDGKTLEIRRHVVVPIGTEAVGKRRSVEL